jgi:hypothetical protein
VFIASEGSPLFQIFLPFNLYFLQIEDEFEEMLNGEMPAFELKDDGCIELVLRLLGRMCDSQHLGLQVLERILV